MKPSGRKDLLEQLGSSLASLSGLDQKPLDSALTRAAVILRRLAALFIFSYVYAVASSAQTIPAVDHHAHLQSPKAARLLNEGGRLHAEEAQPEKENPYTAKDLISALDAAGVRRAAAPVASATKA